MTHPLTIVAHQGGWDELLLVAVPVVLVGGLLMVANRRVKQRLADMETATKPGDR